MAERKIYPSLDIMKFVMAMFILFQHTSNEWAHSTGIVHAFFGIGNFAVPFFFACSGFLFFSKINTLDDEGQRAYWKKWSIRIGKMYLIWSAIYFIFIFFHWTQEGLTWERPLSFLHRALVFSTYATIWFLPALWVGVSICYWLRRHVPRWLMWTVLVVSLLIGNAFGSYTNVLTASPFIGTLNEWYLDVFITWRNGLFNGAPFVFIGLLIAEGEGRGLSIKVTIGAALLFSLAFLFEAYEITSHQLSSATDQGFMMVPAMMFIMLSLVKIEIADRPLWHWCRDMSMLIFLGQRLFLSAIPSVLPEKFSDAVQALPEAVIFLVMTVPVLIFSAIVIRLSSRFKFLKNLW